MKPAAHFFLTALFIFRLWWSGTRNLVRRLPIAVRLYAIVFKIAAEASIKPLKPLSINLSKVSASTLCERPDGHSVLKVYAAAGGPELDFLARHRAILKDLQPRLISSGDLYMESEFLADGSLRDLKKNNSVSLELFRGALNRVAILCDRLDTIPIPTSPAINAEAVFERQLRMYFRRFFHIPCDIMFIGSFPKIPNWITAVRRRQQLNNLQLVKSKVRKRIAAVRHAAYASEMMPVICHDDLHDGNILVTDDRRDCLIIDFEPTTGLRAFDIAYAAYSLLVAVASTEVDHSQIKIELLDFIQKTSDDDGRLATVIFALFLELHLSVWQVCFPSSRQDCITVKAILNEL